MDYNMTRYSGMGIDKLNQVQIPKRLLVRSEASYARIKEVCVMNSEYAKLCKCALTLPPITTKQQKPQIAPYDA